MTQDPGLKPSSASRMLVGENVLKYLHGREKERRSDILLQLEGDHRAVRQCHGAMCPYTEWTLILTQTIWVPKSPPTLIFWLTGEGLEHHDMGAKY
jgi:hypothetical protein